MARYTDNQHFLCPHCGKLIEDRTLLSYTQARAGRGTSPAKARAARRNARKRWAGVKDHKRRQTE
jgi:hypothetical protein